MTPLLLIVVAWLAWSNGANDNFKGVATLYGSGAASFRGALAWATVATVAGSLVSVVATGALVATFTGSGLVSGEVLTPRLMAAVGSAGAITVLLATVLGMPTSTTHALTGALAGAALASGSSVRWSFLVNKFAQPLLLSPVLAVLGAVVFYWLLSRLRRDVGILEDSCVCVSSGDPQIAWEADAASSAILLSGSTSPSIRIGRGDRCAGADGRRLIGISARGGVDALHFLSAGAVCFSRAVNDTPKIAALCLAGGGALNRWSLALVASSMALGGLLQSRKVARTLAMRITELNPGQGLVANLVTAGLVTGASVAGLPVSTTHVSCGAIVGIGLAERRVQWRTMVQIAVTWLTTLPMGFALGALVFSAIEALRL